MDGLDGNGLVKTHFRWKIKWRLEYLGALGIMGGAPRSIISPHLYEEGLWTEGLWVAFCLCFKASPSAKPFAWKFVLFTCKWTKICASPKVIFVWNSRLPWSQRFSRSRRRRTSGEVKSNFASAPPRARKPLGPAYFALGLALKQRRKATPEIAYYCKVTRILLASDPSW